MSTAWIVDYSVANGDSKYVAFAIGVRQEGGTYLHNPEILTGWQLKRRIPGCYAAIEMPEWSSCNER